MLSADQVSQLIIAGITVGGGAGTGWITARLTRRSQRETNVISGSDLLLTQYNKFTQDVQEERNAAKQEFAELTAKFAALEATIKKVSAGYRAYIHALRGQVYDLHGTPKDWPDELEQ